MSIRILVWAQLRSICNSKAVSLTVFLPVIGFLIIGNAEVMNFLTLSSNFFGLNENNQDSFFLNSIQRVYVGLLCLGIGAGIYKICCPSKVKNFDRQEFIDRELVIKDFWGILRYKSELKESDLYKDHTDKVNTENIIHSISKVEYDKYDGEFSNLFQKDRESYIYLLGMYYDSLSFQNKLYTRSISNFFLLLGLSITFLQSCYSTFKVLLAIF